MDAVSHSKRRRAPIAKASSNTVLELLAVAKNQSVQGFQKSAFRAGVLIVPRSRPACRRVPDQERCLPFGGRNLPRVSGVYSQLFRIPKWESRLKGRTSCSVSPYSDGLTDAQNRADEEFGEARLRNLIRSEGSAGAAALKRNLLVGIDEFTAGANQVDDITFLLVERGA
jgi:hypothetical protein